jgi:excisionase family DNA binding protein
MAKQWGELTGQDSRADPALARAASEVRAAISTTACNPTGWATPDQIASRVDLKRALKSLHLSMISAVDLAHIAREVAATDSTLTAPARVIAMRAPGEAEIAREQGLSAYEGVTWASSRQIATNQVIPLPEPVRRALVNLSTDASPQTGSEGASTMSGDARHRLGSKEPRQLDPKWFTVSQVAQLLGYGETKVRMLIISGDLRSLKDGRARVGR